MMRKQRVILSMAVLVGLSGLSGLLVAADGPLGGDAFSRRTADPEAVVEPTPQGCPLVTCNVTDTAFVAAWSSQEAVTGWVAVGEDPGKLDRTVCDQRDEGPECSVTGLTHFIPVTGLMPETTYHYRIYEAGQPTTSVCSVTTGRSLPPRLPETRFGRVFQADGVTPATGAIVRYSVRGSAENSAPLCDLVENASQEGFWSLDRNAVRTSDHSAYFQGASGDVAVYHVLGGADGCDEREVAFGHPRQVADSVLSPSACRD